MLLLSLGNQGSLASEDKACFAVFNHSDQRKMDGWMWMDGGNSLVRYKKHSLQLSNNHSNTLSEPTTKCATKSTMAPPTRVDGRVELSVCVSRSLRCQSHHQPQ